MNYGYTRPAVISNGPESALDQGDQPSESTGEGSVLEAEEVEPQPAPADVNQTPATEAVESDVVLNLPDYSLDL